MTEYNTFEDFDDGLIRVNTDWDFKTDKILDHVDFRTGEIIESTQYEKAEYKHDNYFTDEDLKEYKRTSVAPEEFTSKHQLDQYMSGVDKRKLVTFNSVKDRYGDDRYKHDIESKVRGLNTPMTKLVLKLIDNLDYRNIIIDTKEGLAKTLGVDKKNVIRTLKTVSWLVRVHTESEGMKRGYIKILVHPDFGFKHYSPKHSSCNVNTARELALKEWCKPSIDDVSAHIDWLIDPANHDYQKILDNDFKECSEEYQGWVRREREKAYEAMKEVQEFLKAS